MTEVSFGLKGKRIVLGGGAGGLGAVLALRLEREGARVMVGDINRHGLADLAGKSNQAIEVEHCDFSDAASIDRLVARAAEKFGGIDGVAITVADLSAATHGQDHNILHFRTEIWERALRVNLIGHAQMIKASAPHLQAAGGGSIATVSSGSAYAGDIAFPAYGASKAGLHALVRHTANLLGPHNIRCNGVAPGLMMTEAAKAHLNENQRAAVMAQQALPRLGRPEDVASAMAFLLSDESSWITGQVISINGGMALRD